MLIEDPDEKSHHTSSIKGDNIPLFNTLLNTLDNIHTIDNGSDDAVPDIKDPLTPDFTLTSIKPCIGTSTDVSGVENLRDFEGCKEACNGNVLVEGKRVKLDQNDDDDNQSISRLDEPRPGPDGIDRPTTLHTPHTEEDSTEVEICKPTDCNDPISTKNDTHPTDSSLEGRQHLSNIVDVAKTKDLSPMGTTLADGPLEEPPRISSDQSRGGGGVFWSNPRKDRERTSPTSPTSLPTTITINNERREVNPKEGDDAKSNPLPQPDFDGADPILMSIDQNATLLKGQHSPSLAKMAEMENLPYQEGIGLFMHAPVGTNPNIHYTTTISVGFHPCTYQIDA
jgi:hypothetical protein